jgi:transmembrane sensor
MRHVPEVVSLPDGSTVELKPGTRVQTDFTPEERRVRLDRGDAHFTVAKDAARPFIVTIGNVRVRAVGTAFTISASGAAVEVLVTEGRVRIGDAEGRNLIDATNVAPDPSAPPQAGLPPGLDAGQVAVIPVGATSATPVPIATATSNVVERATAWRSVWLEFGDMPLSDVVREFNREAGGGAQPLLRTADEATGRVLVSGTFRADGIDAFVRLLQTSFGIEATRQPDGSLWLRKSG